MNDSKKIFVSGHRNPDIDSIAAAIALAELRRRQGLGNVIPLCPGVISERTRFLLDRFHLPTPQTRSDVYVRVSDIMESNPAVIPSGDTLWEGFEVLRETGFPRLPVVDSAGIYLGMLSPMGVLDRLLGLGDSAENQHLASREVFASVNLMARAIDATPVTAASPDTIQKFIVYVAAMRVDSFDAHLPWEEKGALAVIVGDRPDIQEHVISRGVRLLIVTGGHPVESRLVELAVQKGVTILESPGDSAQVIRRLAFSMPVEMAGLRGQAFVLSPDDRLRDVSHKISNRLEDVIPVLNADHTLAGIVTKKDVAQPPPFEMILVDHNEIEQSLPGVELLPVIEVVDHHRLKTMPTDQPIRFTADVVGSTCTLVAKMYRDAGEFPLRVPCRASSGGGRNRHPESQEPDFYRPRCKDRDLAGEDCRMLGNGTYGGTRHHRIATGIEKRNGCPQWRPQVLQRGNNHIRIGTGGGDKSTAAGRATPGTRGGNEGYHAR